MDGVALVLSGGGMFGAYQAGVWSELQHFVRPSLVVGASVGCLNGWAIAGGMTGEELIAQWLDPARAAPPSCRWPRSIYDGILDSAALQSWIQTLHATWTPRVRFGVALTRLWTFEHEVVEHPAVTWQHLAASCGVPVFLTQFRIGGQRYTDGGLVTALPLWAARQMGARRVISVNALAGRRGLFTAAGSRLLQWRAGFREDQTPGLTAVALDPPAALGADREMIRWQPDRISQWIELGRETVRRRKHLLCDMFEVDGSLPCSPDEGRPPAAIPLGGAFERRDRRPEP